MHKSVKRFLQKIYLRAALPLESPAAFWLCIGGFSLLLAGVGVISLELHTMIREGAVGIMLLLGHGVECLVAGLAIVTGGVLLLDYMNRRDGEK